MCATFIELAVKLGAVLQETDPAKAAERDRRSRQAPRCSTSRSRSSARAAAPMRRRRSARSSRSRVLPDGRLMDEAIGPRFAIVGDVGLLADGDPMR